MNKKAILELADYIEANPKHYDQRNWSSLYGQMTKRTQPTCGSAGCLAGNAAMLAGFVVVGGVCFPPGHSYFDAEFKRLTEDVSLVAENLLGLCQLSEDLDCGDSYDLFTDDPSVYWPDPYCIRYNEATTAEGRAKVAAGFLRDIVSGSCEWPLMSEEIEEK